ncbi:hypothetical protein [Arcobacter peruensis]|uniref:hypothetical protein n=1 Tax=Arcobacter peruensis TaxID=2320140 RepID=UPI000F08211E|nr:hypothetical protein [Arcobacter peruensis]
MLTYRRRGSSESTTHITVNSNRNTKFLGYCNWSYTRNHHININEAIRMFRNFNSIYIPYYIRIFNEVPRSVLYDFTQRNNIKDSQIKKIYVNLIEKTSFRVKSL